MQTLPHATMQNIKGHNQTMEIEEHDEEEDTEHPSASNLTIIGEINKVTSQKGN